MVDTVIQMTFSEWGQFCLILMAYNIVIAFSVAMIIIASNRGKK